MNLDRPLHPCNRNPHPKSILNPDTQVALMYIKINVKSIPSAYPYALPVVPDLHYGYRGPGGRVHEYLHIPFFQFSGLGLPPIDIGTPGDTYVDIKPGAYAVYTRYRDHWKKWPGPAIGLSEQLVHPHLHEAEQRARYINFAPDHGIEWIAKQTYVRRQQKLRQLGLLEDRHATSAQAGLELASTIVDKYLIKTLGGLGTRVEQLNNTPSRVVEVSSDSDSDVDVVSRPSKRARTAPNAPTDPEIQKLEQIFAVLQTDQNFRQLNTRKRELLRSLDAQCFSNISPQLLKTLEKHFFYASSAPTITSNCYSITLGSAITGPLLASEAEQAIPKLKAEINQVEKYLRATEARRKAAEQRLAEYERKRNSMQSD